MKKTRQLSTIAFILLVIFSCDDNMSPTTGGNTGGNQNTSEAITFDDCRPSEDLVLENHTEGVDYIIDCTLLIQEAGLIIEAGTTILFELNDGIKISDKGYIQANGSTSDFITFSSETKIKGSWRGIEIRNNEGRNSLTGCIVEYAGETNESSQTAKASIHIDAIVGGARANVHQCIVRHGTNHGIYIDREAEVSITDNLIEKVDKAAISCAIQQVSSIKQSNIFSNTNGFDGIELRWTTIDRGENVTIEGHKVLFQREGDIRGPITIQAGSELIMASGVGLTVNGDSPNNGKINANGTASDPIIIRGQEDLSGFWAGILFEEETTDNTFNYVNISDAGGSKISSTVTGQKGIANIVVGEGFFGESTRLTMNNCTVSNSAGCGVFVSENSNYNASNVSYDNNADGNVCNE